MWCLFLFQFPSDHPIRFLLLCKFLLLIFWTTNKTLIMTVYHTTKIFFRNNRTGLGWYFSFFFGIDQIALISWLWKTHFYWSEPFLTHINSPQLTSSGVWTSFSDSPFWAAFLISINNFRAAIHLGLSRDLPMPTTGCKIGLEVNLVEARTVI